MTDILEPQWFVGFVHPSVRGLSINHVFLFFFQIFAWCLESHIKLCAIDPAASFEKMIFIKK